MSKCRRLGALVGALLIACGPAFAGSPEKPAKYGLGRLALPDEVAVWDIDVRADGLGLPEGSGTAARGEEIYSERCASCHGDFGEGIDRWPALAGGRDTLKDERPLKTIGSYWPHASTIFDYVRRAMPYASPGTLSDDEVYALTAYLLQLNDIVTDPDFVLSKKTLAAIRLPNGKNFIADDRLAEPHYAKGLVPCMTDCRPGKAKITGRARALDVTPESGGAE